MYNYNKNYILNCILYPRCKAYIGSIVTCASDGLYFTWVRTFSFEKSDISHISSKKSPKHHPSIIKTLPKHHLIITRNTYIHTHIYKYI